MKVTDIRIRAEPSNVPQGSEGNMEQRNRTRRKAGKKPDEKSKENNPDADGLHDGSVRHAGRDVRRCGGACPQMGSPQRVKSFLHTRRLCQACVHEMREA